MGQEYVILRKELKATRTVSFGPRRLPFDPTPEPDAGIRVDVDDLDRSALQSLARSQDVVAVAPTIPMKLITPVAAEPATLSPPVFGTVTWGVRAVGADTSPFTGRGITVAVLDTGIDASHPAFAGVELIQADFSGEGNGDRQGHGTHCAGTIFGRQVGGMLRIGVAPGVTRALIAKVFGAEGASSEQTIRAIQWAAQSGAHVISMSLSIDFPGLVQKMVEAGFPPSLATSRALEGYRANVLLFERLASFLRAPGSMSQSCLLVAAAGNDSQRHINPQFEIAVGPPAVAEGFVSVGALGEGPGGLGVAPFSNTGASVAAPGVGIISAAPGGGLAALSGTSMATPHVAGVAALWAERISSSGQLTNPLLTARLVGSADTRGLAVGFDPAAVGAGLVRAPSA